MGNALVRAQIQRVRIEANGDYRDAELRKKLDELAGKVVTRERQLEEAQATGDPQQIKKAMAKLENAQAELKKRQRKDNIVTAILAYPRSGESSVVAIRPMDLPAGATVDWSNKDFFDAAIFKETIQGETVLEVKVGDKDKRNPFWLFVRGVLSTIFKTLAKDAIEGISEVFVSKTADGISGKIENVIKGGDKDRVTLVAASEKARIEIDSHGEIRVPNAGSGEDDPIIYDPKTGILSLQLTSPSQFVKKVTSRIVNGKPRRTEHFMEAGEPNGFVELRLGSEP